VDPANATRSLNRVCLQDSPLSPVALLEDHLHQHQMFLHYPNMHWDNFEKMMTPMIWPQLPKYNVTAVVVAASVSPAIGLIGDVGIAISGGPSLLIMKT
jgi:hypothetical protein